MTALSVQRQREPAEMHPNSCSRQTVPRHTSVRRRPSPCDGSTQRARTEIGVLGIAVGRPWQLRAASTLWPRRQPASTMDGMPVMTPSVLRAPRDPDRQPEAGRDAAHVAYDHAAALLASAQALEAAARAPGAVPALAPTLACIEASLEALALTAERLRGHTLERLSDPILPAGDLRARRADVATDLARLASMLEQGSAACMHARRSIAPVVNELTAI
jgi:hypothetical protein